jgi:two-component system chemotaxis response regulator CheY
LKTCEWFFNEILKEIDLPSSTDSILRQRPRDRALKHDSQMSTAAQSHATARSETVSNRAIKPILIIDDTAVGLNAAAIALKHSGFDTLTAQGGAAAFAILEKHAVSLIVLDYQMPEMDGLEFLRRLRADSRHSEIKVIMLTSSSDKAVVGKALRLGIAGYLLKSKDVLTELLARVHKVLDINTVEGTLNSPRSNSSSVVPIIASIQSDAESIKIPSAAEVNGINLVSRDETLKSVLDLTRARTLSGCLKRVIALCSGGRNNLGELTALIGQDPILFARVLLLARSATKAKAKLNTIDDVIRSVGAEAIGKMASSIGTVVPFEAGTDPGLDLLGCWEHGIATAKVMSKIVAASDQLKSGVPHVIGLCHDLPELLLRQRFPKEYSAAENHALKAGRPTRDLLTSVFGLSYEELTKSVLDSLMFPAELADPILEFVRNCNASPETCTSLLSRSLSIANAYVHGLMLTASVNERISPIASADCRKFLIQTTALNAAEIRSEAINQVLMLAELTAEQEEIVLRPRVRNEVRVWYARHPSFSAMDPVGTALAQLCDVGVNDRVPTSQELSGVRGMVIVEPGQDALLMSGYGRLGVSAETIPVLYLSSAEYRSITPSRPAFKRMSYPVSMRQLTGFISTLVPRG